MHTLVSGFNKDEGSLFIYSLSGVDENNTVEDPTGTLALAVEEYFAPLRVQNNENVNLFAQLNLCLLSI